MRHLALVLPLPVQSGTPEQSVSQIPEGQAFESEEEVAYVVGGERVYRRTLESQLLTRLELTEVHIDVDIKDGDKVTYFPEFGPEWVVERREEGTYTRNKGGVMVHYSFVDYVR